MAVAKRYRVTLTAEECEALGGMISRGKADARKLAYAQFLLAEVPLAAVGQHLRQHQRPPRIVDVLIRVTFDAVVKESMGARDLKVLE